jgi:hypothetical protein
VDYFVFAAVAVLFYSPTCLRAVVWRFSWGVCANAIERSLWVRRWWLRDGRERLIEWVCRINKLIVYMAQ